MKKIACAAVVKNEERYISEWILYQLALGFDAVIIIDNLSSDSTSHVASALSHDYDVRIIVSSDCSETYQRSAYMLALEKFGDEFEWIAFFDIDEFLALDAPFRIRDILLSMDDVSAVGVNWAIFGSSKNKARPEGLVIENYLFRSENSFGPNKHIKSIVRPTDVIEFINGHSFSTRGKYKNLSGELLTWETPGITADIPNYKVGKLNHYFTRSWDDWEFKLKRGYPDLERKTSEFFVYDKNDIYDNSATRELFAILCMAKKLTGKDIDISASAPAISSERGGIVQKGPRRPLHRFVIAACGRWENRYLIEWVEYHRSIGVEHIYFYCNDDSPIDTYRLLLPYIVSDAPFITFHHYNEQGEHRKMMMHFLDNYRTNTEWLCFLDIDEFIRLPKGLRIGQFMHEYEEYADCVMFNWIAFGPNGYKVPPEADVLVSYTRREATLHPYTKYFARASVFDDKSIMENCTNNGFVHGLNQYLTRKIRSVNVLGESMDDYYTDFPSKATRFIHEPERHAKILNRAVIHHYAFRSEKAFFDRVARGTKGDYADEKIWGELAQSDRFSEFLEKTNAIEDLRLCNYWNDYIENAYNYQIGSSNKYGLISVGGHTTQSSVCEWSKHQEVDADSAGAINGVIDGQGKFHTDLEDGPWWQIDLRARFGISEIRVYNRLDDANVADRASKIAISVGFSESGLVEVYRRETAAPFGGLDGKPLIFKPGIPILGRFVRISLLTRNYLHLDQVEIYGECLPEYPETGSFSKVKEQA